MIYTNFGTPVEVIGGDIEEGFVTISRLDEPGQTTTPINTLKADGGIEEIIQAIEDCD